MSDNREQNGYLKTSWFITVLGIVGTALGLLYSNVVATQSASAVRDDGQDQLLRQYAEINSNLKELIGRMDERLKFIEKNK